MLNLVVGPMVDPTDLGVGFYQQWKGFDADAVAKLRAALSPAMDQEELDKLIRVLPGFAYPKVAIDEDFKNKLNWLGAACSWNCGHEVHVIAQTDTGDITHDAMGTPTLPSILSFRRGSADELLLDCAQVSYIPHVARVDLINQYGGGDANVLKFYTPPSPPQLDGRPSPIGAPWPERGGNAYRPSIANPRAEGYQDGDIYEDITGRYTLTHAWVWVNRFPIWIKQ